MKIFITGGTGFIGKYLIRRLAGTKHELVCLARMTSDVKALEEAGVTIMRGDVTEKDSLLKAMEGCGWVINLANLIKKPPILDMAIDQMRLIKPGIVADGSKAVRDLGISYKPVRSVLEEVVLEINSVSVN